jgi:hypothetical protein
MKDDTATCRNDTIPPPRMLKIGQQKYNFAPVTSRRIGIESLDHGKYKWSCLFTHTPKRSDIVFIIYLFF